MTDKPASPAAPRPQPPSPRSTRSTRRSFRAKSTASSRRLRNLTVVVLLGIYYGLPWINWGDRQALLLDLPARKFYIFGLTLWPQDLIYLSALLIIAALSLFFFTALAGRLWCGYACPQTVWTEMFIIMERWIEGRRQTADQARQGADVGAQARHPRHEAGGLDRLRAVDRLHLRRLLHAASASLATACSCRPGALGDVLDLLLQLRDLGQCRHAARAGLHLHVPLCALPERDVRPDTLLIAYDTSAASRGARASKASTGARPALGDCIDCGLCVQVCPTGIDIRDGLQYQCIGCAACVDVCDEVMEKMGYPKGLVRYTTERALERRQDAHPPATDHPLQRSACSADQSPWPWRSPCARRSSSISCATATPCTTRPARAHRERVHSSSSSTWSTSRSASAIPAAGLAQPEAGQP